MAITLNGHAPDLLGVSGDTKPAEALQNQLFLELDTATFFYFDGAEWQELGNADNNRSVSTTPDTRELTKSAPEAEEPEQLEEPEPVEEIVEPEPVKKTTTRTRKTTTTEG